ncbi:hypothetical protein GQ53DRAFT_746034 [Thozetella sp. PMI_491]|nr:hypothetical protein GQ53DRAFT_746034 [Thozetella sp. PMI_491]
MPQPRKTGVTLKDTGVRDEHGMEPLDALLSSPEKGETNGNVLDEDEDDDDSEDGMEMDIDYSKTTRHLTACLCFVC